jgi:hypothetical protein
MGRDFPAESKARDRTVSESEILKGVVRQHWHDKLETMDKTRAKALSAGIDAHLANVAKSVNQLDYEVFCIPNIIYHSKHMSKEEFEKYLRLMEAMAVGYSSMFGNDVAGLALIGISSKAKNAGGIEKYHRLLSSRIETRMKIYRSRMDARRRSIDVLHSRLRIHNRSVFRFFRKGRIYSLSRRIDRSARGVDLLSCRLDRLNEIYKYTSMSQNKD